MEVFSSRGNGTLTVIKPVSPTKFEVVQNLETMNGAHTLTLNRKAGRVYVMSVERGATSTFGRPGRSGAGFSRLVYDCHDRQVRLNFPRIPREYVNRRYCARGLSGFTERSCNNELNRSICARSQS